MTFFNTSIFLCGFGLYLVISYSILLLKNQSWWASAGLAIGCYMLMLGALIVVSRVAGVAL